MSAYLTVRELDLMYDREMISRLSSEDDRGERDIAVIQAAITKASSIVRDTLRAVYSDATLAASETIKEITGRLAMKALWGRRLDRGRLPDILLEQIKEAMTFLELLKTSRMHLDGNYPTPWIGPDSLSEPKNVFAGSGAFDGMPDIDHEYNNEIGDN